MWTGKGDYRLVFIIENIKKKKFEDIRWEEKRRSGYEEASDKDEQI